MEYCHNCGEAVSPDDRFCDNCRADLKAGDESNRRRSGQSTDQQRRQGGQRNRSDRSGNQQRRQGSQRGRSGSQQRRQSANQQQRGQRGAGGQQQLPQDTNGVFGFGFGYPVRDGWKPLLLSSVMVLLSFLLIPLAIVAGYGFRVARAAALGRPNPPKFNDWGGFIFDGLRLLAVTLIPGLAWILLIGVGFGVAFAADSLVVLALLFAVSYVVLLYAVYAFMTAFVGSNSVVGAFTDGRAISLLTSVYYLKSVLLFIVFNIALSIVLTLASFTLVGVFIGAAFQILALGAFWGYVYYQAVEKGIVPRAEPDSRSSGQTGGGPEQSRETSKSPY